ncbi:MAG TPA: alcohol dehydrogenase catalytic domain-containing protein, partial [Pseudonocardia sp.]|nr:alcohol dehydrogenase catalytic domain-containing protein [Pseudonocardia sp.]
MRAYRYTGQHKAELAEVPIPEPRHDDVLVRVGASGACYSDLGILAAPPDAFPAPLTLGHEVAGYVESLGPGVSRWEIGEPVVVHALLGCGRCR